jgi:hypothetical protein
LDRQSKISGKRSIRFEEILLETARSWLIKAKCDRWAALTSLAAILNTET